MKTITVIGGTGYVGAAIVAEALSRGLTVRTLSRSLPSAVGVHATVGSVLDRAAVAEAMLGADVVVGALSPRGELEGHIREAYDGVLAEAASAGIPVIIVGGFGSLRPAPGAPRIVDGPDFPAEYRGEAAEMAALLPILEAGEVDWLFVSPAMEFGAYNPGERTGRYALGNDVAHFDEHGRSTISGADFAIGIIDLVIAGGHHREHLSLTSA